LPRARHSDRPGHVAAARAFGERQTPTACRRSDGAHPGLRALGPAGPGSNIRSDGRRVFERGREEARPRVRWPEDALREQDQRVPEPVVGEALAAARRARREDPEEGRAAGGARAAPGRGPRPGRGLREPGGRARAARHARGDRRRAGPAAVDSIVVTRGDVDRLEPDEFLNDNLVDLYVKVLVADAARSRLAAREGFDAARLGSEVHAFSSHFFTKLQEEGLRAPDGKDRAYDRVERWTRGVDVFSKKFLVVPIVEHLHWSLAIVCHPGALVRVVRDRIAREEEEAEERARGEDDDESDAPRIDATAEPSGAPPPPRPCIIFMDSLKMHSAPKVERFLRAFLELEWAKRKPDEPELKLKLKVDLPLVVPKVPMQTNSCDCGVYVLRYAEEFLSRAVGAAPTVAVTEAAVDDKFAAHDFASWFTAAEVAAMRGDLKAAAEDLAVAASASA